MAGFSATMQYCTIFALLPFSLSVPLWQAGMEETVVYPGKLPIVSGGNSLWERATREQGSAQRETAASAALAGLPCIHWDLMPGVRWPSPETG